MSRKRFVDLEEPVCPGSSSRLGSWGWARSAHSSVGQRLPASPRQETPLALEKH